jgi:hypothetical protein
MLNIHTPLRWFRLTIERSSRLNLEKPDTSPTGAESSIARVLPRFEP